MGIFSSKVMKTLTEKLTIFQSHLVNEDD